MSTPNHFTPEVSPLSHEMQTTIAERHPDWQLNTTFWFGPHTNAADAKGMAPYLAAAKVFLYENDAYDLGPALQEVSSNPQASKEDVMNDTIYGRPIRGSEWEPVIEGIYGSGKIVGSFDLKPEEQHIRDRIFELAVLPNAGTFDTALTELEKNATEMASLQGRRDELMTKHFEEEMTRIFQQYPELQNQPVDVLCAVGPLHPGFRRLLNKQGIPSEYHFSTSPYVYGYYNQLLRTIAAGHRPDRQLLVKAYTNELFRNATLIQLGEDADKVPHDWVEQYTRWLASHVTESEAEGLYTGFQNNTLTADGISAMLVDKGLGQLPRSAVEAEKLKPALAV